MPPSEMPRNVVPRHRDGQRNWHRLDANERAVVAHLAAAGTMRTVAEIAEATRLSRAQVIRALGPLASAARCAALRYSGPVVARVEGEPVAYRLTAAYLAERRP